MMGDMVFFSWVLDELDSGREFAAARPSPTKAEVVISKAFAVIMRARHSANSQTLRFIEFIDTSIPKACRHEQPWSKNFLFKDIIRRYFLFFIGGTPCVHG